MKNLSLKKIQSLLSKKDIVFEYSGSINLLYTYYYNELKDINQLSQLYVNNITTMQNNYNRVLQILYNKQEFIDSYNYYHQKLQIYKDILKDLNGQMYYGKELIDYNAINSFFINTRISNYSSIEENTMIINNKQLSYKYLYFDVEKEYTDIINYLGFLNKFQYDIIYYYKSDLSSYLFNHLVILPQYLELDNLYKYIYVIIPEYLQKNNLTIEEIKDHWLMPKFTNKDQLFINKILSKKLLKHL